MATPELHSDEAIESDPLLPGQVWGVSLGTGETGPGLYRIEVTCGPGSGVRILNQPTPPSWLPYVDRCSAATLAAAPLWDVSGLNNQPGLRRDSVLPGSDESRISAA